MTLPGGRLRAIFARLCSPRTIDRLIDPVLSDLQAEYHDTRAAGQIWKSRRVRVAGYLRWSLPFATFALALFALSAMPRRPVGRSVVGVGAIATCLAYYGLLFAGELLGRQGTLPAFTAAWLRTSYSSVGPQRC